MLAKIHEVGQKYLTYSAGSDQEKSLWLFEPHFCDGMYPMVRLSFFLQFLIRCAQTGFTQA